MALNPENIRHIFTFNLSHFKNFTLLNQFDVRVLYTAFLIAISQAGASKANILLQSDDTDFVFIKIPNSSNSCVDISLDKILKITTKCRSVVFLSCAFSEKLFSWRCESYFSKDPGKRFDLPISETTIRKAYIGVCKADAVDCTNRQKWLIAAVADRQNPFLAVQSLRPGLAGEPLDPSLQRTRKRARG